MLIEIGIRPVFFRSSFKCLPLVVSFCLMLVVFSWSLALKSPVNMICPLYFSLIIWVKSCEYCLSISSAGVFSWGPLYTPM